MKYNRIGRAGVQVSAVGLGTWNTFGVKVERSDARKILCAARDAGINFLDTADTYANGEGESILGELLAECNRDDFVVGTKLFFPVSSDPNDRGLSRKHIVCSVRRSLKRLRSEYIDLLQCHRFDAQTPLDETVMAMDDLVRQGDILYWGVSRFGEEELVQCRDVALSLRAHRPISNQFFYNLLDRRIEPSIVPTCRSLGIGVIGYSPLAQGVLSGKYLNGAASADSRAVHPTARKDMWQHTTENTTVVRRLHSVAVEHGLSLATVAIAWCLRVPGMASVLTGATSPEQIRHNAEAADLELSPELLAGLEAALNGQMARGPGTALDRSPIDSVREGSAALCN